METGKLEPIAIIGMGCRFPGGANDPESFWKLMRDEIDAISEVPPDRFNINAYYDSKPATPGKIITRCGGFLDDVDKFDAYFFGISPREARLMDPQQRVLLEVAWEAMEDAGLVLEKLADRRSRTGVFVGMQTNDYEDLMFKDTAGIDSVYVNTGGYRSVAAGRVSFAFDFRGPSVVVDAAAASSLVSVHLACQSLHMGECDLALAAGTNLVLQPDHGIAFSQGGVLAPDGRCKFADSRANGFVRSDGVGVVVLKRLSEAQADGDAIYAVIRGSASNNDGRSGDSMMAPSALGQQAVLEEAYRVAGVSPGSVHYLECHGTGTSVGDPIELKAASAVLSKGRAADHPLFVGSVKTNLGHTEGAAGIAGLIKAALCLKHRAIPASLHVKDLPPEIPWKELPVVVQRQFGTWPVDDAPARAAVSSFGINGANAHVVLEEAPRVIPAEEKRNDTGERVYLLPLSARAKEALSGMAERWQAFLSGAATTEASDLLDICYTASVRRTHHDQRLALVGHSRQALAEQLKAFVQGEAHPLTSFGEIGSNRTHKVVFVFPGQGGQWLGMGKELLREEPVFRQAIQACDRAISQFADWSLLEQLNADEACSRLDEVDVVQPAIFAMQVALAALWRSLGIEPAAVVGQSMGEVAAAHVSGALTLDDAARIICRRSQIVKSTARGRSGMAVVGLSLEDAERILRGYEDRLSVAVSNSPTSTVLSGYQEALDEVLDTLEKRSVFCRRIKVDYASHSPQMDPLKPALLNALESLRPRPASTPFYSTVNNTVTDGQTLDAAYWVRSLRGPVLMARTIEELLKGGHTIFIEMNPHPLLLGVIRECMAHWGYEGTTLPSLRRDEEERAVLMGSLGSLYTIGYPLDWTKLYPASRRPVRLPAYAWQREHFWFKENWCQSYPAAAQSSLLTGFAPPPTATDTPRAEGRSPTGPSTPPPESWLISQIQEQAAKVLGLSPSRIAPNKRLEAYGLDSLMGVELSVRLAASLGVTLPGNIVWQHPTVAQLAAHLAEKADSVPSFAHLKSSHRDRSAAARSEGTRSPLPAYIRGVGDVGQSSKANSQPAHRTSSLVPLKPEGSKPPLFLVPPAAYTVSTYGPLLKHLESDQPVYGLQYLGMDGKDQPHDRVEGMAAHYKNEILQVQPHGPYLLAGRCFGGLVALEIALQLRAEGHEVAMLALIDVVFPPATRPLRLGRWALTGLYFLRQAVLRAHPGQRFANLPDTQTRAIIETLLAHRRARLRYVGRVYPGKITLFAAEADNRIKRKFQARWENRTTGGLQRHDVPGNHRTLVSEPHVRILAAKLTESIDEGLAGRRVSV